MYRYVLLLAWFFCSHLALFAQFNVEKWGKIPPEDLQMTVYPQDSGAAAVVLQDIGFVGIENGNDGFEVRISRHCRIKVFDTKSFEQGNLKVYFRNNKSTDRIRELDVQVINTKGEKQKVNSDNFFTEKINNNWSVKKIFVPNLQAGDIIEYRYTLRTESFLQLDDWYFQGELPVRWSEVTVELPDYFEYVCLLRTGKPLDVRDSKGFQQTTNGQSYPATATRYGLSNLPGLKEEPYITTLDDYRSHVGFQLKRVVYPGEKVEEILTSWEKVGKELDHTSWFGEQFSRPGKSNDAWAAFTSTHTPDKTPAILEKQLLEFVSSNLKWDGDYSISLEHSVDKTFELKKGSSGDLNLSLVALLRRAGLDAYPVLVSTRENGEMYPQYPFVGQFNSVIAFVREGDGGVLLDATNPFFGLNELQEQHYNGKGWACDPKAPFWLDIAPPEMSATWYGKMKLTEEGEMSGNFSLAATGHLASSWRESLNTQNPTAFLKESFGSEWSDMTVDSVQITDKEEKGKTLAMQFKCTVPGAANVVNDRIYCRPVLDFLFSENPFKTLERYFPVDFSFPIKGNYILQLDLPEGYVVEELPQPARISLPDNGGKISYSCAVSGKTVQVNFKMNVSQLRFEPDAYSALRQYFDLALEKTKLQLVLKKA